MEQSQQDATVPTPVQPDGRDPRVAMLHYWRKCRASARLAVPAWHWVGEKLWFATAACFAGAVQAVSVKEYSVAAVLFLASAASLVFFSLGWKGIEGHPHLTRAGKGFLIIVGVAMLPISILWVYKQKGNEPWSIFLRRTPQKLSAAAPDQQQAVTSTSAQRESTTLTSTSSQGELAAQAIREGLGRFVAESVSLRTLCSPGPLDQCKSDRHQWEQRVLRYLKTRGLDSSFADRWTGVGSAADTGSLPFLEIPRQVALLNEFILAGISVLGFQRLVVYT